MIKGDVNQLRSRLRSLRSMVEEAIVAEWPRCIRPLIPELNPTTREDPITRQLYNALVRTKRVPGRFVTQYEVHDVDEDGIDHVIGRIDLILTIGDDEEVYLACECKRLNVPQASGLQIGNGPYVDEGLIKFIDQRYSRALPAAMMVAYTLNGDTVAAVASLERTIRARDAAIGFRSIVHETPLNGYRRFHTVHDRPATGAIELSHTILPWLQQLDPA